jgi:hypothetical protein
VSESGELVFIGSGVTDGNQNNRYIELNPSVTEKGTENKSFTLKLGDKIAEFFVIAKDKIIAFVMRISKKN